MLCRNLHQLLSFDPCNFSNPSPALIRAFGCFGKGQVLPRVVEGCVCLGIENPKQPRGNTQPVGWKMHAEHEHVPAAWRHRLRNPGMITVQGLIRGSCFHNLRDPEIKKSMFHFWWFTKALLRPLEHCPFADVGSKLKLSKLPRYFWRCSFRRQCRSGTPAPFQR